MTLIWEPIRHKIVKSIFQVQESYEQVSRSSIFLAISICDKYFMASVDSLQAQVINQGIFSIACLLIAWKFQGDAYPNLDSLKKCLKEETSISCWHQEIVKLEQKILIALDFEIPPISSYEFLDSSIHEHELNDPISRRDVAKSIKILCTAALITFQLSVDPQLGAKIHEITKKTQAIDSKARNIYRKCLKYLQTKKTEKVTAIVH